MKQLMGVGMIAGAIAGMVFGVIDPATGYIIIGNGATFVMDQDTKKPNLKGKVPDEHSH